MSVENKESTQRIPVFPLQAEITWQTVNWMYNSLTLADTQQQSDNINSFWEENGSYYVFIRDMGILRCMVDNLPQGHIESYERGFIFAVQSVRQQYQKLGKEMPEPTYDDMLEYYETLLIGSNVRDLLAIKEQIHIPAPQKLEPRIFAEAVRQERIGVDLRERVRHVFQKNTFDQLGVMKTQDPNLYQHLRTEQFYKSFGPNPGLAHGVLDGYQLIYRKEQDNSRQEEKMEQTDALNRMWDIEIK